MRIKELILGPACVCDGGPGGQLEQDTVYFFQLFLENDQIVIAENLYKKKHDLSKYKTLAFATTGYNSDRARSMFNFDKSNLTTVVVLNQPAIELVRSEALHLDLNLIGFNQAEFRKIWKSDQLTVDEKIIKCTFNASVENFPPSV
ncbi:MAG: hypothetical protein AAB477_03230 [Patescibacteria group bacterium]